VILENKSLGKKCTFFEKTRNKKYQVFIRKSQKLIELNAG